MYLCFIDNEKAFDRVKREDLLEILKGTGVDGKYLGWCTNFIGIRTRL